MTTSPVVSVTDELVEELERSVECVWPETDLAVVTLRALLSERAELLRDAERYRFLKSTCDTGFVINLEDNVFQSHWDKAIDAAMQSEAKP